MTFQEFAIKHNVTIESKAANHCNKTFPNHASWDVKINYGGHFRTIAFFSNNKPEIVDVLPCLQSDCLVATQYSPANWQEFLYEFGYDPENCKRGEVVKIINACSSEYNKLSSLFDEVFDEFMECEE